MIMWDIHKGELKLRMDEHSDGVYQSVKIVCDLSLCIILFCHFARYVEIGVTQSNMHTSTVKCWQLVICKIPW